MKWPALVQPWACRVPVTVHLTGAMGEDGTETELACIVTQCSFDEKQHQILDARRQLIRLQGTLLFPGDIAPETAELKGTVELLGRTWKIYQGSRGRNPDGSVNYTRIEVM